MVTLENITTESETPLSRIVQKIVGMRIKAIVPITKPEMIALIHEANDSPLIGGALWINENRMFVQKERWTKAEQMFIDGGIDIGRV